MNISVKSDYALLALFDLAMQSPGEPIRIAEIARRQKIPQKFLELILAGLRQAGFVESRRGAEGGYMLARPPASFSVGDVLRAVEGKDAGHGRPRKGETPFSAMWRRVDDAVSGVVDNATFATILREWSEKQNRFIPNWDI